MSKKGCLKWGGIGCGAVVAILIIVAVVLYMNRGKIMDFFGEKMKESVMQSLPADYPEEEAEAIFNRFWTAIKEGRLSEEEGQKLGELFRNASQDGTISGDEALDILDFMKEAIGPEEVEEPLDVPIEEGAEEVPAEV